MRGIRLYESVCQARAHTTEWISHKGDQGKIIPGLLQDMYFDRRGVS